MSKARKTTKRPELPDRKSREAIVGELDRTVMVEAGAGSGKTTSLASRMVALIAEGKARIERIAALTFTRKAASELKEKFQIKLEEEYRESSGERRERLREALASLEQGVSGTIHSFCARLLRERPMEAGIDPEFTEMDEIEDSLHTAEVWSRYLIDLMFDGGRALDDLRDLGVTSNDLYGAYERIVMYPEVSVQVREEPRPDTAQPRKALERFLSDAGRRLPGKVPAAGWDDLQEAIRNAQRMRRTLDLGEHRDFHRILEVFDKKNLSVTQNRWPSREDALSAKGLAESFRAATVLPALTAWRRYRHSCLMKVILPAAERCRRERIEASKLNFQDLLMRASSLLRDNPEVRTYFSGRYTHLLVDEFQDTDPIQAEVMLYLTGEDVRERDWRKLRPRSGSLFIVGDPKQSIYRFRRADFDTYSTVKEIVEESEGLVLPLVSNFRSLDVIGEWLNPIFTQRFPEKGSDYQAPFSRIETVRKASGKAFSGVRKITVPQCSRHNAGDIVSYDAGRIAAWIRQALDGGITLERTEEERTLGLDDRPVPSDFLILLRNKKMIPEYAGKLEELGIPFEAAGGNALSTARGLREVLKILRAVSEPDSSVNLVSALRGLFFGVSDEMLYRFHKAGGRFSFFSQLPPLENRELSDTFTFTYDTLKRYHDWAGKLPPSVAIEKIIEDTGLVPYLLSGPMGGSQTGNMLKVVEFLQQAIATDASDFLQTVEQLEALMEGGEFDEIDIAHGSLKAVRIMNLHKAKGLEAPVVFLANPTGRSDHPPDLHITRKGNDSKGYFVIAKKGEFHSSALAIPPDWEAVEPEEAKYESAEEDRLLYVASTRARNLLVVSVYPASPDKSYWSPLSSFLGQVEELDDPGIVLTSEREALKIKEKDFRSAQNGYAAAFGKIGVPTHTVRNVTSLTKEDADLPVWKKTGRGFTWGNVIHRVLEILAKDIGDDELEILVANVLAEEGRSPDEKPIVLALVKEIRRSEFWAEVQAARDKYMEVPFSLRLEPSDLAMDTSAGEWVLLSGIIDLVYKGKDGWTIVDYKTDDIGERINDFVKYYTPQVRAYRRFWEEMSGEKVTRAGIFFVHTRQFIEIPA
ncbi:MAG: UvrD-helicase domain-containing protein [Chloroflexota bacterium]